MLAVDSNRNGKLERLLREAKFKFSCARDLFQEREPLEKGQGLPPSKYNQKPDKEIARVIICSRGVQ